MKSKHSSIQKQLLYLEFKEEMEIKKDEITYKLSLHIFTDNSLKNIKKLL